jgi:type IV fimbrial biogenesis protein FimT
MQISENIQGVTLIELMVVITIAAILLALAVPSFQEMIDRNRLKAATESVFGSMQFAKSEAIKRNERIFLIVAASTSPWQYYLTENSPCLLTQNNTAASDYCGIDGIPKKVSGEEYPNVSIGSTETSYSFSPLRGTLTPGTITLNSGLGKEMRVVTSGLGRIRICSPSGNENVAGYSEC